MEHLLIGDEITIYHPDGTMQGTVLLYSTVYFIKINKSSNSHYFAGSIFYYAGDYSLKIKIH